MLIGFFTDSYFPTIDGVTYTIATWKTRLEKRGHELVIYYPANDDYTPAENEIPCFSISNPFYSGYRIPFPTYGIEDFDLVHVHSPVVLGIQGLLTAKRRSIPAVYTHHTPLEEYFDQTLPGFAADPLGRLYMNWETFFLSKFDVVTTNTDTIGRDVETTQLPVGVDMEFFRPSDPLFTDQRPIIGYSGRLSKEKRVGELLELAETMDAKFLIVGEGPKKPHLMSEAPDNVEFHDFLPRAELPRFYSSLDAFTTASRGDTLGLSTLEANACGTPVVAPDVSPFTTTIGERNGILYASGDTADFRAKTLAVLHSDWDTRTAVRQYSLQRTMRKLEAIYRSLLSSTPSSAHVNRNC